MDFILVLIVVALSFILGAAFGVASTFLVIVSYTIKKKKEYDQAVEKATEQFMDEIFRQGDTGVSA